MGQAMVEFALVVLIFLAMLIGIIEGARWISSYFVIANAAGEGARAGAFVPTTSRTVTTLDSSIRTAVHATVDAWPWITVSDGNITICRRKTSSSSCDATGTSTVQSGSYIEVTVTSTFYFLAFEGGWLGRLSYPLTGFHRARID
jgi:Flp pilus assembly protein TadG